MAEPAAVVLFAHFTNFISIQRCFFLAHIQANEVAVFCFPSVFQSQDLKAYYLSSFALSTTENFQHLIINDDVTAQSKVWNPSWDLKSGAGLTIIGEHVIFVEYKMDQLWWAD